MAIIEDQSIYIEKKSLALEVFMRRGIYEKTIPGIKYRRLKSVANAGARFLAIITDPSCTPRHAS